MQYNPEQHKMINLAERPVGSTHYLIATNGKRSSWYKIEDGRFYMFKNSLWATMGVAPGPGVMSDRFIELPPLTWNGTGIPHTGATVQLSHPIFMSRYGAAERFEAGTPVAVGGTAVFSGHKVVVIAADFGGLVYTATAPVAFLEPIRVPE